MKHYVDMRLREFMDTFQLYRFQRTRGYQTILEAAIQGKWWSVDMGGKKPKVKVL